MSIKFYTLQMRRVYSGHRVQLLALTYPQAAMSPTRRVYPLATVDVAQASTINQTFAVWPALLRLFLKTKFINFN